MANDEDLARLRQGGAHLFGAKLVGAHLSRERITGANLSGHAEDLARLGNGSLDRLMSAKPEHRVDLRGAVAVTLSEV